jgi:hypothetical protein
MQHWEYRLVSLDYENGKRRDNLGRTGTLPCGEEQPDWLGRFLNDYGANGWELVGLESIISTPSGYYTRTTACRYILKRPAES